MKIIKTACLISSLMIAMTTHAARQVEATIYSTDDAKTNLGKVVFKDTAYGLLIIPQLTNLPAGLHGFHLHQHSDCNNHGQDAGAHFDPRNTNTHLGPYGQGHLGDLPALYVNSDGTATTPTLAPRLETKQLKNLAVMVHAGGDNYSDTPPLGGGGDRIACGPIK